MSLRKSPQRKPKLLAATRRNAQHSTGPRTAASKQNSKLNALNLDAFEGSPSWGSLRPCRSHGQYVSSDGKRRTHSDSKK